MKSRAKLKIRKNDDVIVVSGRDKGRTGTVLRVMPDKQRLLVQGVNMAKRHTRPSASSPGGILDKETPIHVSNLALVDPKTGSATRVGFKTIEGERKVRFAKKSGEIIDR